MTSSQDDATDRCGGGETAGFVLSQPCGDGAQPRIASKAELSGLLEAARAVLKAQADFKSWAEAGVMRGLLPYTEDDLRKASLEAFDKLRAAVAEAAKQ